MPNQTAIDAWRELLGEAHVLTDAASLAAAGTTTFATTQRVPAIVRPASVEDVQACVRIANRFRAPIYPVSRGHNWGYGSRVPASDGCAVLDLSRMQSITDYSEDLATITVEPGVTAGQVYTYLKERGSNLLLSRWGVTPDGSLVGVAVERGFAIGPYTDRFDCVCGLEVVLPTGELVHTGFGRFANAKAAGVYRWGVGPAIDGLFSQSNLGIVTRMTVWLAPRPADFRAVWVSLADDSKLAALVDALRQLMVARVIDPGFFINNHLRRFPSRQQYPWDAAGGVTPLPKALEEEMRERDRRGTWECGVPLYSASGMEGWGKVRTVRAALRPVAQRLLVWDRYRRVLAKGLIWLAKRAGVEGAGTTVKFLDDVFVEGTPAQPKDLQPVYWRKRIPVPEKPDPDRDRCGLLWCTPVTAASGAQVAEATQIIREVLVPHGFEAALTVRFANRRSIVIVSTITYDRDVPGEDERAARCHDEVLSKLMAKGYYPYRLGINDMNALAEPSDDYVRLVGRLKAALDPNDILAPGRYDFRPRQGEGR